MRRSAQVLRKAQWVAFVAVVAVISSGSVTSVGAAGGPEDSTRADSLPTAAVDRSLPFHRGHDLAIDPATGRAVVSGPGAVSVRDADGSEAASFEGLDGPREVVVDDGTFYVLLHEDPTILAIDVATATETGRWDLGTDGEVMGLAVVAGRLWTTAVVGETARSQLVSVDLGTGAVVAGEPKDWTPMDLASSPAHPSLLAGVGVARTVEGGDGAVRLIDVVTGEEIFRPSVIPFPQDIAFSADGATVHVAASYTPVHHEYRVADLTRSRVAYPVSSFPSSVETSSRAGGLVAIGASNTSAASVDLWVFRQGVPAPVAAFSHPDDGGRLVSGALGFTPTSDAVVGMVEWPGDPDRPAELLRVPIGPRPGDPTPRVLGTRGGGTIEVAGSALGRATATIGGTPASTAWSSADRLSLRAPALPAGPAPIVVANGAGLTAPTPTSALVIDLGPHRDAHSFADAMTRAFLGRPAASDEEIAEDVRLAAGGEVGALPLALAADPSFARLRTPLIRLYQAVFLRPPDTAGLAYWHDRMERGESIDAVATAFAGTPEFRSRYAALADGAFVDRVYANVLGRSPDAPGRAYWIDQLRRGVSRGRAILLVSASSEFRNRVADQVALTNVAVGVLGRALTRTELAAALARVSAGESLAAEATRMIRSPEHTEVAR